MTRGELLDYLTKEAKRFTSSTSFICMNEHLTGVSAKDMPNKQQIDGVVVAFINYIGMSLGIDYALNSNDLENEIKNK